MAEIEHGPISDGYRVRVSGSASEVDDSLPLTRWIVPFKLFCRTILRFNRLAYWFHERLKLRRIAQQRPLPILIEREFRILPDGITIEDTLEIRADRLAFIEVHLSRDATVLHSLSSRLYPVEYLLPAIVPVQTTQKDRQQKFVYTMGKRFSGQIARCHAADWLIFQEGSSGNSSNYWRSGLHRIAYFQEATRKRASCSGV